MRFGGSAIGNAPNLESDGRTLIAREAQTGRIAMLGDKRKAPRRHLRYTAWISLGPKKLQGCVVADISDFGARLRVENGKTVPDHFVLLLSASGKPKRKCRVIWRKGAEIGLEFEKPLSRGEKHRPILKAEKMSPPLATLEPELDEQDASEKAKQATKRTEPA